MRGVNTRPHPKRYDRRRHGFRLTCRHCFADNVDSIPEAKAQGWDVHGLISDFRDAPWTHIGICPDAGCRAEEDGTAADTRREVSARERAKTLSFARIDQAD